MNTKTPRIQGSRTAKAFIRDLAGVEWHALMTTASGLRELACGHAIRVKDSEKVDALPEGAKLCERCKENRS